MSDPTQFLQLQNAKATEDMLARLGISFPVRFEVLPFVMPTAEISGLEPTQTLKLAIGRERVIGVAAETTHLQLFNPVNSNVRLRVEKALVTVEGPTLLEIRFHDTALTVNSTQKGWRDRRLVGAPIGEVRGVSLAVSVGSIVGMFGIPAAFETLQLALDTYLGPGQGVLISATTADIDTFVTYFWDEELR